MPTVRNTVVVVITLSAVLVVACRAHGEEAIRTFTTGGHTVYHLRSAQMDQDGSPAVVAAALDGTVMCFTPDGRLRWEDQTSNSLPLDLDVADIDGDGRDETLVASADGQLYVLDHTGRMKWRFSREPPLVQVCSVADTSQGTVILTGGIEKTLYALSGEGELLAAVESPYVVRHIRCGDFFGNGKRYAAVVTAKNDRSRFFLQLYDPVNLSPVWEKPVGLATSNPTEGTKFYVPWLAYRVAVFSVLPMDIDHDGRDEILLTDHFEKRGAFYAYNDRGGKILTSSSKGIRGRPYRMNLLTRVTGSGPEDERIFGLFGNQIIVYRTDGLIEKILSGPLSHACAEFDPVTRTLFLGSSISGGDGIYALRLDQPDWESAYQSLKPVGRIAQVERNMARLAEQVEHFQRPAYQQPPKDTLVITGKSADELRDLFHDHHDYERVRFAQFNLFTEGFDRETLAAPWNTTRETRHKYNFTAKQIVAFAAERERLREPFALWAGHGNDPFYMQLSTIEAILKAAPTMAKALVFPEMERTDGPMQYAAESHIIPVAELCRKHGTAKVILRNKNIFWNASCYLDLWRNTLLGGEFRDVFVPSMEETNGRTQAISLSGRMGLWMCGVFDRMSARAVTDNANFSRFWEWSSQQRLSHLFRSLSLQATLGADMFLVNIYQGDPRELTPFYRMLEKGVIAVPDREDLLSISDTCLGMRTPSVGFLKHGKNGHQINGYEPAKFEAVFDRMDCYWGGAPTNPSDFSNYAMGSRHRMLNFLPTNPYGLIASVPADSNLDELPFFERMLVTDGEFFFSDQGKATSAATFKERAMAALRSSAIRLPVRVAGDVAWSVVRLDPTHVRVTLIDPGYLSPADRRAKIVLQHLEGVQCIDVLRSEKLALQQNALTLTVPAGVLRIVDITHE